MDEKEIGFCPRCGRELVRGATPTGKVCFRCPSCGGMAVTLPVLRESLDAKSIAALTRSARAAEHVGCLCPGCAGRMTLLKVGDGKDKLEIDVCGRCLSVWCDKGEYETLAPPAQPRAGEATMRQILERADYILADSMIMGKLPSGRDNRLWMVTEIPDADKWMEEYFAHVMKILDEPISIYANPTYLPTPIAAEYDRLWTGERMRAVIAKCMEKGIAIEIQAESAFPRPAFLRLAKEMGAKF